METLTIEQLKDLAKIEKDWCTSIYMPAHRTTVDSRQDPVRYKNLLRDVEKTLEEKGMRRPRIDEYLEQASGLLDSNEFWKHQGDGLAVFVTPDDFQYFRLPIRLDELTSVTDRFIIKPLLPLVEQQGQYLALLLSQKDLKLYRCSRFDAEQVELADVPTNIEEIMKYEDPEKQLQYHTETAPSREAGDKRKAMYHGHGVGVDDAGKKRLILRYFHAVDKGLEKFLNESNLPLVLIGLEHHLSLYEEANSYTNLIDEGVKYNPDDLNKEQVIEKTWQVMEPIIGKTRRESMDRFQESLGTGKATDNTREVIKAAVAGRIDTLFIDKDESVYGNVDLTSNSVEISKDNSGMELLNYAAAQALLSNGKIFILDDDEKDKHSPLAALYRY